MNEISSSPDMASRLSKMVDIHSLQKLRPMGKLEQVSSVCHHLGYFYNVGISAQYKLSPSASAKTAKTTNTSDLRHLVFSAAAQVLRRHRILTVVPVDEEKPDSYFAALPSIDLTKIIRFQKRSQPAPPPTSDGGVITDPELDALLEKEHNTNFLEEYGTRPFWRLVILQDQKSNTTEFVASFIYHHAIGDGVSGLVFQNDFRAALDEVTAKGVTEGNEIFVPDSKDSLLQDLYKLHPVPINPKAHAAAEGKEVHQWTAEKMSMPLVARWKSLWLTPETSKAFFRDCKEHGVTVTAALASVLSSILFGLLPSKYDALTCIIPINLRPWLTLPRDVADHAMGTFFDATRVRFDRDNNNNSSIWPGAETAAKSVQSYLQNVSPSGEPYTAIAAFQAVEDMYPAFAATVGQPRDAAFEVTNVGQLSTLQKNSKTSSSSSSSPPIWEISSVLLSRSAAIIGAAITVSVGTGGNGAMAVGFSWQEGVVEEKTVDDTIQGVRQYFDKYHEYGKM